MPQKQKGVIRGKEDDILQPSLQSKYREKALNASNKAAQNMLRRNLKKDPPSKNHTWETVRVRVMKQTAAKRTRKKLTPRTHTEGKIIKTDHNNHRYNIKYIDPKSGTMVKKWFSVNDVTSLTLDEEANRQKKAVKETSEKRTKHKNKSKDTSKNADPSKTTSKEDDDSTSFKLIEEGDNHEDDTFKSEGSQLDKSVNEIVENQKLSSDTIGLYFDYLKCKMDCRHRSP